MRRALIPAAVLLIGSGLSTVAAPAIGANGGKVQVVEGHPVEMVVTDQVVTLYLSDDDRSPLSTKSVKARAIFVTGGKTVTLPLVPDAPNKLVGTLAAPLADGDKVLLSAKLHGHKLEPRFVK